MIVGNVIILGNETRDPDKSDLILELWSGFLDLTRFVNNVKHVIQL